MILDVIKKLRSYAYSLTEDDMALLGFTPVIDDVTRKNMYKAGWWPVLLFAMNDSFQFGLRIIPWMKPEAWPVVMMNASYSASTIAPRISAAFPLIRYKNIHDDEEYFKLIRDEWNNLNALVGPIDKIVSGERETEMFKTFLFSGSNLPGAPAAAHEADFKRFWSLYDTSPAHDLLRASIDEMALHPEAAPDLKKEIDYGIWQTRLFHVFDARISYDRLVEDDSVAPLLLKAFDEPLNFDPEDVVIRHYPNQAIDPKISAFSLAEKLVVSGSPLIGSDPLMPVMRELVTQGRSGYNGVKHLEAAAVLDDRLKNPVRSWNALVSAAYWSGQNGDETLEPVWEAAIYLCRKSGWEEAAAVLEESLNFYKSV